MKRILQLGQFGRTVMGAGGGGGGSAYDFRTQFGGADASTTITEDSGKSVTAFGNCQIDTSLGDQRCLFDGNGDYFTSPSHADFSYSDTESWQIEFTMRYNSLTGFQTIIHKGYAPSVAFAWLLQTGNGNGRLIFYVTNGAGSQSAVCTESSGTINTGQDYAIRIRRTHIGSGNGVYTIERDGVTVATSAANTIPFNTNTAVLAVGGGSSTGFNNFWFNGSLKDLKISNF